MVTTHPVFSLTIDEPIHLAAGLEWLDPGRYGIHQENPPLSRIPLALPLYLAGFRLDTPGEPPRGRGLEKLDSDDPGPLSLARFGNLPFFLLTGWLIFAWTRKTFGLPTATLAVGIYSLLPPVLAHSGLATTDMPFTTMFLAALFSFVGWLEQPTWPRTLLFAALLGAAMATKFTSLALLPCMAAILLSKYLLPGDRFPGRQLLTRTPAILAVALLVIWGIYRFSFGTPAERYDQGNLESVVDICRSPESPTHGLLSVLSQRAIPAPELFNGLVELCAHNATGHEAYLLGRTSETGFLLYYPVALLAKSPIPFLLLVAIGVVLLARSSRRTDWWSWVPIVSALCLLATCMAGRINIGIRHILPVYPLLAIVAAWAIISMWSSERHRRALRAAAVVGGLWLVAGSLRAHPDYLAYFNVAAAPRADHILLDSDLDWGQDLLRLRDVVHERGISHLSVAYSGIANPCRQDFPAIRWLPPGRELTGWVAISEMHRKGLRASQYLDGELCNPDQRVWVALGPESYAWLDLYEPAERVGSSILLYHIPKEDRSEPQN